MFYLQKIINNSKGLAFQAPLKLIISDYLCEKLGIYVDIQCIRLFFAQNLMLIIILLKLVSFKGEGKGREEKRRGEKIGGKERDREKRKKKMFYSRLPIWARMPLFKFKTY